MAKDRNLILTICTGNICRSPMAEKLLQHALNAEGAPLNQLKVVSAGVASGYSDPASSNSVAALKKVKLDLTQHQSQPVTQDLIDQAFAIFGMTDSTSIPSNTIIAIYPSACICCANSLALAKTRRSRIPTAKILMLIKPASIQ